MLIRTYLYAPGNRPDLFAKALAGPSDAVILDLEDAVPAGEKAAARQTVAAFLDSAPAGKPIFVRLNAGNDGLADLAAFSGRGLHGVRLPKAESPDIVGAVAAALDGLERMGDRPAGAITIQPLLESVAGVFALPALAAASSRIRRFAFGAGDFVRDIGGEATADRSETFLARSMIVAQSRLAGLEAPVAHVFTPIRDLDGLRRACLGDRAIGFYGRSCIHPSQVPVVNAAFDRSGDAAHSRRIIDAYAAAVAEGRGSLVMEDGTFVDEAVARRAEDVLSLVDRQTRPDGA